MHYVHAKIDTCTPTKQKGIGLHVEFLKMNLTRKHTHAHPLTRKLTYTLSYFLPNVMKNKYMEKNIIIINVDNTYIDWEIITRTRILILSLDSQLNDRLLYCTISNHNITQNRTREHSIDCLFTSYKSI